MIKGIIFDWGGVVIEWDDKKTYRYISERFNLDFDYTKWKIEYELLKDVQTGKIDEKEMWNRFFSSVNMKLPEDYETLWVKKFAEYWNVNEEVIDIVKSLKKRGYKTALLSNVEPSHADYGKKQGIFRHFSPVILSYEIGLRKPDDRIYMLTLDKLGLKREECVYVDDREENLKPARRLGIHTILSKNTKQLRKDLSKVLGHGI